MLRAFLMWVIHMTVVPPMASAGALAELLFRGCEGVPRVARPWSRWVLRVAGVRLVFRDFERLRGPAVVVMNHCSAFDIYLACGYLPIPFRMVAKESLFRIPVFGWALSVGGFIPLERRGRRTDVRRISALPWDPRRSAVVCFFPEGTRSLDGRLRRFKKGAFVAALHEKVPVIPVAISGTQRIQPPGRFAVRPGIVEVRVLDPIDTAELGPEDRDRIAELAYERILAALPPEQRPL